MRRRLPLHGYGADGADLLSLADVLGQYLPDTAFYAPDAPEPSSGNPFGRQWFPIPWLDGSSEEQARSSMAQSAQDLNAFLDKVIADEDHPGSAGGDRLSRKGR